MRVLIVSNLFPPEFIGGYELIAHELAVRLAGAGHEVAVATSALVNHDAELPGIAFEVHRTLDFVWLGLDRSDPASQLFRGAFVHMANIAALRRAIAEFRPDRVLLCNIAGLGALGLVTFLHEAGFQAAIYLGDNVFEHAGHDPGLRDAFIRLFRARPALAAPRVLAVSRGVHEETEATLGTRFGSPVFVPGWIPADLPPLPARPDTGRKRFVFCSRLAPHKGIWLLLDAVRLLLERGERDFTVDLYGGGLTPEVIQRVHGHGLGEWIRYAGMIERDEMIGRFAEYDALLFPTWPREPLGLVAFEAAAQGCISILTRQAGACEWLLASDCIKIDRSPEGLAGGMQRVLYMGAAERDATRAMLSEQVRRLYSADVWLPRVEQALAELAEPRIAVDAAMVQNAMFAITRMWRG